MTEQTPQEIAAQAVDRWYSSMDIVCVATHERAILEPIIADAIAADRQQRDAVHAAEVARVRRETRLEDAKAACHWCKDGLSVQRGLHDFYGRIIPCDASRIHKLIAQEEAAHVDA